MKTKNLLSQGIAMMSFLILFSALFLAGCNKKDTNDTGMNKPTETMEKKTDKSMDMNSNKMTSSMDVMMDKMHKMKMTGNMDVDFVTMMIMHHQAAVDMSKNEVITGKDEKVKKMAENIIKDQANEIETMQTWLDANKDKKGTADNSSKLMSSMMGMMGDHKMSGDADKDFLSMMIIHHQGAVDMADVEVKYGSDNEIKKMASGMITKQKDEIKQMKDWQK